MEEYTYILAPYTPQNWGVLISALNQNPEIQQEARVKTVYAKSEGDIVGDEGQLLVPADPIQYIYMKAQAAPTEHALLAFLQNVENYSLYSRDTQPFNEYWL